MNTSKFTNDGRFLMLALDHRESFKKILSHTEPEKVTDELMIEVKKEIIESLRNQFSGILIDPKYGFTAYKKTSEDKPFLLSIEKSGYQEFKGERITKLEYSVSELKAMGAEGVKLLIYLNPLDNNSSSLQIETVKKVWHECRRDNLPLFLEIVTYRNEKTILQDANLVIESVKKFLSINLIPDVFKLEYPGDEISSREVSQILGKTPWILLTRGENFEIFKIQLKTAILSGASGFLAGRALWQEIGDLKGVEEKREFLKNIVKKRFQEISSIVMKNAFLA